MQLVASDHLLAACIWLSLAVLPAAAAAGADTLSGKVVGVADGDTLTVLVELRTVHVRVAGIDAPEKGQPYGQVSKQGLSKCAFGNEVEVEWHKKDRYGRPVGKVMVGQVDCGLRQIEQGLAWHYKAYAKDQTPGDRVAYAHAEAASREGRAGLWREAMPVAPWEYRHQKRLTAQAR